MISPRKLVHPSDIDLANAIECNVLGTADFNRRDVRIANKTYDPSANAVKGKWTKKPNKMDRPANEVMHDIPDEIMKECENAHLDIDMMSINKIPFFTAISRDL